MFFGRERDRSGEALVTRRDELDEAGRLESEGRRAEAITLLAEANRSSRDLAIELNLRRLRHLEGIALIENAPADPHFARPAAHAPELDPESGVPECGVSDLTPELLRASILRHGCLLVRGLMDGEDAEQMARGIERSVVVRSDLRGGGEDPDGFYDEFEPEPPYKVGERAWIEEGGGVLATDSPRLMYDMLDGFERVGLSKLIAEYLGERPAISAQKCTLRKATPDIPGAWHQDGKFLGDVRSLNVWLSLSRCGDVAPSMDIVPRRIDHHVETGGEGTFLHIQISQATAEKEAGEVGIVRPIFNPGDALLFDELFLHQTGSDPSMPNPRYAIESWFFGPSAYPANYVPIAF